jgi:localization factor PodJL
VSLDPGFPPPDTASTLFTLLLAMRPEDLKAMLATDPARAAPMVRATAEIGVAEGQVRFGRMLLEGQGVPANPRTAFGWFSRAGEQDSVEGWNMLGRCYENGWGVAPDFAEAARWFAKAAALGLSDSQFNLAVLYERGDGVPQSLLDAYKWYAIAAANGDGESKARIDALSTQLSPDDRAAAQHAVDAFKAGATDPHANIPPQQSDLPQK